MNVAFDKKSSLCELHFREEDILRCDRKVNNRGKVIVNPNKQSQLRKKNGIVDVTPILPFENQLVATSKSSNIVVGAEDIFSKIISEEIIDESTIASNKDCVEEVRQVVPFDNQLITTFKSVDIAVGAKVISSEVTLKGDIVDESNTTYAFIDLDSGAKNTHSEIIVEEKIVETSEDNIGNLKNYF